MNFIDWCHYVLDSTLQMYEERRDIRFSGFLTGELAERLFDVEASRDGTEENTALRGALVALREQGCLDFVDHFAPEHQLRYYVTDKGRGGSNGMIDSWWSLRYDLDPDQVQVYAAIHRLSQEERERFARIHSVSATQIADELGWHDRMDQIRAYIGQGAGNVQLPHIICNAVAPDDSRGCRATYESLVIVTHADQWRASRRAFEQLMSPTVVPSNEINLTVITDSALRKILEHDYAEAEICLKAGALKAATLLLAGILEGIFYDYFQRPNILQSAKFQRAKEKMMTQKNWKWWAWDRIGLDHFVTLAEECNLLDHTAVAVTNTVRSLRDTIHPYHNLSFETLESASSVELVLAFVRSIQGQLEEKAATFT